MKVLYVGILKFGPEEAKEAAKDESRGATQLCGEDTVKSYYNKFTGGTVAQVVTFGATQMAKKTTQERKALHYEQDGYLFYSQHRCDEDVCGVIITDQEYPERVASDLLSKVCDEFVTKYPRSAYADITYQYAKVHHWNPLPMPELKDYLAKYQDPQQADTIMRIQKELAEAKDVVYKTVDSLVERGQKIEDLVAKSDILSAQSKMFYTQAKKQNSCCVVM